MKKLKSNQGNSLVIAVLIIAVLAIIGASVTLTNGYLVKVTNNEIRNNYLYYDQENKMYNLLANIADGIITPTAPAEGDLPMVITYPDVEAEYEYKIISVSSDPLPIWEIRFHRIDNNACVTVSASFDGGYYKIHKLGRVLWNS